LPHGSAATGKSTFFNQSRKEDRREKQAKPNEESLF